MTNKNRFHAMVLTALLASMLVAGCAESTRPKANGKGFIRGINSIVTAPELIFRIEERSVGSVNFRDVAGFDEWDGLNYNFSFDLFLPGASSPDRIATEAVDILAETEHTMVLTGTLDNPSIWSWQTPRRVWSGTETVFEADFIHVSPLLGEVDIYYAVEGTPPVLGNEIGTLTSTERLPYLEFPAGDYELIITAPDDPTTILFQSSALTRAPAERISIAIFDPDPSITAPVGVNIIFAGGASQGLSDINSPPLVRTYHAAFGTENFSGYFNNDFNNVIYPNVAFGEISAYADITETLTPLTLTAVGDPTDIIHEVEIQSVINSKRTLFLFGEPDGLLEGALFTRVIPNDARPLSTFPVIRVTNFSSNLSGLDIYDVESGTVIDEDVLPRFAGTVAGLTTQFFDTKTGARDIVITLNGEKDPVAAPLVLDLANGSVVDMVILDTINPTAVELKIVESLP
jgi:hypothetical protein